MNQQGKMKVLWHEILSLIAERDAVREELSRAKESIKALEILKDRTRAILGNEKPFLTDCASLVIGQRDAARAEAKQLRAALRVIVESGEYMISLRMAIPTGLAEGRAALGEEQP